jgi:uncharacterized membrane protein
MNTHHEHDFCVILRFGMIFMKKLGKFFFRGILMGLPMLVGLSVFFWVFRQIEDFFKKFLLLFIPADLYYPGMGPLVGILFFCLIGVIFSHQKYYWPQYILEYPFKKIPILRTVYQMTSDFMLYFSKQKQGHDKKKVVKVWNQEKTAYMLGLLPKHERLSLPDTLKLEENHPVFIPFSFMMGGLTIFVSLEQIEETDLPFDVAMRGTLSGWIVTGEKSQRMF